VCVVVGGGRGGDLLFNLHILSQHAAVLQTRPQTQHTYTHARQKPLRTHLAGHILSQHAAVLQTRPGPDLAFPANDAVVNLRERERERERASLCVCV